MAAGLAAHPTPDGVLLGDLGASRALQLVQTSRRIPVLAALLGVCFVVGPLLLMFAPWQQNIRGSGRVVAYAPLDRQQQIEAPIDGRIVRWWVQEGSVVRAKDPLVEISDIDPDLVGRLEQERDALQRKLEAYLEKAQSYDQQVANLEATRDLAVSAASFYAETGKQKVLAARATVDAARTTLQVARAQFDRNKNLLAEGIVSQRDFEVSQREFDVARTAAQGAEAALAAAENDQSALQANLRKTRADADSKIDSARASLSEARGQAEDTRASLAKLAVSLSRQQSRCVLAPRDGTIFRLVTSQDGEIVKTGEPLLTLVPDTADRAVEMWVDGNDAPLVGEKSPVRLQFEGWPAVQFVGWPSVAVGTFGGRVALVDATDDGKGRFRLLVVPDPSDAPWPETRFLRQGVRAKGWVLLNEVTIGYEFWRQLNGFPPVIAPEEPKSDVARKRLK